MPAGDVAPRAAVAPGVRFEEGEGGGLGDGEGEDVPVDEDGEGAVGGVWGGGQVMRFGVVGCHFWGGRKMGSRGWGEIVG